MGWRDRGYSRIDDDGDDEEIEYAELTQARVKAETELAILVAYGHADYWIPRSLVEDGDDIHKGFRGTVMVELWFAEKEHII